MSERRSGGPEAHERRRSVLAGALLAALVALAYLPAVLHGGYVWDDDEYLTHNVTLSAPDALRRVWLEPRSSPQYYPLVFTTFLAERRLWGLDPRGFHAVNAALHAASAVLVWRLALLLGVPAAWLVAAVFGLHPVHVESVAWVTERKNVLSGLLYLGAMLAYLRFELPAERTEGGAGRAFPRRLLYLCSLLLFAGALLSKTVTSSLPAAVLLLLWWKRGRVGLREGLPLLPFLLLGLAAASHTAYLEKFRVGAHGPEWALGALDRVIIAARAVWFYAGKILWPNPLLFIYPRWRLDGAPWWWLFPAAGLAAVLALWLLRGRIGRGPLVAVLFTAGTLVPALGFVNFFPMRYSFVADHFQYLASLGTITLLVGGLAAAMPRHGAARLAAALLLAVLGALTWRQSGIYRDADTVWRDVLAKDPDSPLANLNLGRALLDAGDLRAARAHFERALRRKPDFYQAHYNLGLTLGKQGDLSGAKRSFESAIRFYPYFSEAYENLGVAHAMAGEAAEARRALEKAVELKPGNLNALLNLGLLNEHEGDLPRAREVYRAALAADPRARWARERLAAVEARLAGRGGPER